MSIPEVIDNSKKKIEKKRDRTNVFQKDEEGNLLVPVEQLKYDNVMTVPQAKLKVNRVVSDEVRAKQVERGKQLGLLRKEKCEKMREEKLKSEEAKKVEEDRQKAEELDAHKKEIEKKILEGKLVKVRVKKPVVHKKKEKPQYPLESSISIETEEETDTDLDEKKHIRKKALKTVEAIERIDQVIQKARNPYMDKILNSFK
jgi:hypothetical protein